MRAWVLGGIGLATLAATQLDKPATEVSQNYRGPEGSIELEGVCKIDETSVTCWKADRTPHPELQQRVLDYANKHKTFVTFYGYKTRYAVFRIKNEAGSLRISDIYNMSLDLGSPNLTAVPLMADRDEDSQVVRFTAWARTRDSEPLRLVKGERLRYKDGTITVVSVVKSQIDPLVHGVQASGRWLIHFTFDKPIWTTSPNFPPNSQDAWRIVGLDGKTIEAVNFLGEPRPASAAILDALQRPQWQGERTEIPNVQVAGVGIASANYSAAKGQGTGMFVSNVNPKFIKHVVGSVSTWSNLTVKDIPMEPKP